MCVGDEGVVDGILAASWRWLVGSRLLGWEGWLPSLPVSANVDLCVAVQCEAVAGLFGFRVPLDEDTDGGAGLVGGGHCG